MLKKISLLDITKIQNLDSFMAIGGLILVFASILVPFHFESEIQNKKSKLSMEFRNFTPSAKEAELDFLKAREILDELGQAIIHEDKEAVFKIEPQMKKATEKFDEHILHVRDFAKTVEKDAKQVATNSYNYHLLNIISVFFMILGAMISIFGFSSWFNHNKNPKNNKNTNKKNYILDCHGNPMQNSKYKFNKILISTALLFSIVFAITFYYLTSSHNQLKKDIILNNQVRLTAINKIKKIDSKTNSLKKQRFSLEIMKEANKLFDEQIHNSQAIGRSESSIQLSRHLIEKNLINFHLAIRASLAILIFYIILFTLLPKMNKTR